jgi:hypothetical protein
MSSPGPVTITVPKPARVPLLIQLIQAIIAILSFLLLLLSNKGFRAWLSTVNFAPRHHSPPVQDPDIFILHGLQAVIIFVVIFVSRFLLKIEEKKITNYGPIGKTTFEQFSFNWLLMWFAWLALYIWLFARAFLPPSDFFDSVTDVFNILSGFAIWRCFFVLRLPSVNLPNTPENDPPRDRPYRQALKIAGTVGFVCACFGPADRFLQLGHVGLACVGLYGGLALASLVGRLGSHYIGMPLWTLLLLYLYAMLQLFYSFFDILSHLWMWVIFGAVLVLKIVLGFAGIDMLHYGGLDNYLKAADTEFQTAATAAR